MEDAKLVGRNTVFMTLSQIGDRVLLFVIAILLARYLGVTDYGTYAFAIAFVFFFSIIIDLGLGPLLMREIARDKSKADKYLSNVFIIKLITSALSFALIALVINLTKDAQSTIYAVYLAAAIMILFNFCGFFQGVFIAFERMQYNILFLILLRALSLVGVIIALSLGWGLLPVMIVLGCAHFLTLIFTSSFVLKRFVHLSFDIDFELWKSLIKRALPFALMAVFILIYFQIDRVMLSYMVSDAAVGLYVAACNLAFAFMFISVSISIAIFPAISRLYGEDNDTALAIYRASFKYLLAIGLPIAIGTILLAPVIIKVVYGQGYLGSVSALQVVACVLPFMYITQQAGVLAAVRREKILAWLTGLAAVVNIAMNLALIPIWGIIGAALATLITTIFVFAGQYYFISKFLGSIDFHKIAPPILIANIILGLAIYFIQDINIPLAIFIAIAAYFGILYLLKFVSKEEIALFKKVLWVRRS